MGSRQLNTERIERGKDTYEERKGKVKEEEYGINTEEKQEQKERKERTENKENDRKMRR